MKFLATLVPLLFAAAPALAQTDAPVAPDAPDFSFSNSTDNSTTDAPFFPTEGVNGNGANHPNIWQSIQISNELSNFTDLLRQPQYASLVTALSNTSQSFAVFAPSNAAFSKLQTLPSSAALLASLEYQILSPGPELGLQSTSYETLYPGALLAVDLVTTPVKYFTWFGVNDTIFVSTNFTDVPFNTSSTSFWDNSTEITISNGSTSAVVGDVLEGSNGQVFVVDNLLTPPAPGSRSSGSDFLNSTDNATASVNSTGFQAAVSMSSSGDMLKASSIAIALMAVFALFTSSL